MIASTRSLITPLRLFCQVKEPIVEEPEDPELRDRPFVHLYSETDKSFFPEHSQVRDRFALYNFMSYLPLSVAQKLSRLTSETKTIIQSDNVYLPRLTPNGIPIYDSLKVGKTMRLLKSSQIAFPLMFVMGVHFPFMMAVTAVAGYFALYRGTYTKLGNTLVIKMELIPETEQIIFQKVGSFGVIKTTRIKIDDLEYFDKSELSLMFYRSTRSFVDKDLMFRVKSTGQQLLFDPEGLWYEEGINHQLMI